MSHGKKIAPIRAYTARFKGGRLFKGLCYVDADIRQLMRRAADDAVPGEGELPVELEPVWVLPRDLATGEAILFGGRRVKV